MANKVWQQASGRIRAIAFHCQRCKAIHFEIITESMAEKSEDNLQCYDPPDNWARHEYGLFCPNCNKKYIEFMRGD